MTFNWENIADKVLFVAYRDGDMITVLTEDGREYLLTFDEFDGLEKEREILERFLGEQVDIDGDSEAFRESEKWFYKWLPFAYFFVKKEFFGEFSSEFEKQSVKRYLTALDTARALLDPNGEYPRMIIRQQRRPEKWEALTVEQKQIKDIEESLKKTEREISENKQKYIFLDELKANIEAIITKHKAPEPVILPFEWEDITEAVTRKFVFIEFRKADTVLPCCINAITQDGCEYVGELNEWEKEDNILERFLGDDMELDTVTKDTKGFRMLGKWLYKQISGEQIFVRKDFFDRFISEYEKQDKKRYSALISARKLLNSEHKQPRMMHSATLSAYGD
ncbi:MAG: hypothetical protein HDT43_06345 [Ruminococcaceae bacterium]|nr:hypothetical protein [Oscillospiraceae bacterium]